jgi:hypothetical protein
MNGIPSTIRSGESGIKAMDKISTTDKAFIKNRSQLTFMSVCIVNIGQLACFKDPNTIIVNFVDVKIVIYIFYIVG